MIKMEEEQMEIEQRRRILRGMLALGGALALNGCTAMSPAPARSMR